MFDGALLNYYNTVKQIKIQGKTICKDFHSFIAIENYKFKKFIQTKILKLKTLSLLSKRLSFY